MRLVLDATQEEYKEFLEDAYRDGTWDNPICAWIQESHINGCNSPSYVVLNYNYTVTIGYNCVDYISSEITIDIPEWIHCLIEYYCNNKNHEWTKAQALSHYEQFIAFPAIHGTYPIKGVLQCGCTEYITGITNLKCATHQLASWKSSYKRLHQLIQEKTDISVQLRKHESMIAELEAQIEKERNTHE